MSTKHQSSSHVSSPVVDRLAVPHHSSRHGSTRGERHARIAESLNTSTSSSHSSSSSLLASPGRSLLSPPTKMVSCTSKNYAVVWSDEPLSSLSHSSDQGSCSSECSSERSDDPLSWSTAASNCSLSSFMSVSSTDCQTDVIVQLLSSGGSLSSPTAHLGLSPGGGGSTAGSSVGFGQQLPYTHTLKLLNSGKLNGVMDLRRHPSRGKRLTVEKIAPLLHGMTLHSTVTALNVAGNGIAAEPASLLCNFIHTNSSLTDLNVSFCRLSGQSVVDIVNSICTSSSCKIHTLNLANNNIDRATAVSIANILQSCNHLEDPDAFEDSSPTAESPPPEKDKEKDKKSSKKEKERERRGSLTSTTTATTSRTSRSRRAESAPKARLQRLVIRQNPITVDGLIGLLQLDTGVRWLDARYCGIIPRDSIKTVCVLAQRHPTLESLQLHGNHFRRSDRGAVAAAVSLNTRRLFAQTAETVFEKHALKTKHGLTLQSVQALGETTEGGEASSSTEPDTRSSARSIPTLSTEAPQKEEKKPKPPTPPPPLPVPGLAVSQAVWSSEPPSETRISMDVVKTERKKEKERAKERKKSQQANPLDLTQVTVSWSNELPAELKEKHKHKKHREHRHPK